MYICVMKIIEKYQGYAITKEGMVFSKKTNKYLRFSYDHQGYQRVHFYLGNYRHKTIKVHRLVAESFIPNPLKKKDVNHIDGNKSNNHVSNLEWCTRSENIKHAFKIGLSSISEKQKNRFIEMSKLQKGEKSPSARKIVNIKTGEVYNTIKEVLEIVKLKRTTFQAMLSNQNPNKTDYKYYEQPKRKSSRFN